MNKCENCQYLVGRTDMICQKHKIIVAWSDFCMDFTENKINFIDFIEYIKIRLIASENARMVEIDSFPEVGNHTSILVYAEGKVINVDIAFMYDMYLDGDITINGCYEMIKEKLVRNND